MKKKWILNNSNTESKFSIDKLLEARGIIGEEEKRYFLNPLDMPLTPPEAFTDMKKVVQRLAKAIDNKEKIVIYGDFDADGVTSTSVLLKTFKYLEANVEHYIPDREKEGHGLNKQAIGDTDTEDKNGLESKDVVGIMTKIKPKVLITVDCGISNYNEVKFINSFKTVDVIITDHHEAPKTLPEAYAIINPKAPNSLNENLSVKQIEYLTYLAGCGVAYKVAQGLLNHYNKTAFLNEILPFVAIGTIGDIVPLIGENRYFVSKGLDLISQGKHEGIKSLLKSSKYDTTKNLTAENIAFGIVPRINAAGRLGNVEAAINILTSNSESKIKVAIEELNNWNNTRQRLCDDTFAKADETYKKEGNKNPAIILYDEEWHIGIIGIVASRFVDKYHKPTFLMTKKDNIYRCSARGIKGLNIYNIMRENAEMFENFGGHELAGGLSFNENKYSFDEVKKALIDTISEQSKGIDLKPFINIDMKLDAEDISIELVEHLEQLEPFGANNPNPIFETDNFIIKEKKLMGDGKHLRLRLQKNGYEFTAIKWKQDDIPLKVGDRLDLAYHPQKNEYNENTYVQLIIDDMHSELLYENEPENLSKYEIIDNRKKTDSLDFIINELKNTNAKVKIFAESILITNNLRHYPEICSRIFTRNTIEECDCIMFFDYPADRETFDNILNTAKAKKLYFMYFEPTIYNEENLLQTFYKMINSAIHKNNGKIEFVRCASYLGKSLKIIKMLLELSEKFEIIKIKEKSNNYYIVEKTGEKNIFPILNSSEYAEIFELSQECDIFRQNLLDDDLEQII